MKTFTSYGFAILTVIMSCCISCQQHKSLSSSCKQEKQQVDREGHLFDEADKPACHIVLDISTIKELNNERLKDTLNSLFIFHALGDEYTAISPEEAVNNFANQYIKQYREEIEPLYIKETSNEDIQDVSAWFQYYLGIHTDIERFNDRFLVYNILKESYTGGAHGMYTSNYLNIDLQGPKLLHIYDVIKKTEKGVVTELIWKYLALQEDVTTRQELEELGYGFGNDIEPSEIFILGEDSLTFVYNPYDIAPYSMGKIHVSIPLTELKPFLQLNL